MTSISLSRIHPFLYIGNVTAAQEPDWTHVLCTAGCRHASGTRVTNCAFLDTTDTDAQPVWHAEYHIRNGALLLDKILRDRTGEEAKQSVLVHCQAGMNRSASVIVAYAIGIGWKAEDAIEYIRSQNAIRLRTTPRQAAVTNPLFEFVLLNLKWHSLFK